MSISSYEIIDLDGAQDVYNFQEDDDGVVIVLRNDGAWSKKDKYLSGLDPD